MRGVEHTSLSFFVSEEMTDSVNSIEFEVKSEGVAVSSEQ